MFTEQAKIMERAERAAERGADINAVLAELRNLSLDHFGEFLIHLPNRAYPALSKALPPMASPEIQQAWTGASGMDLFRQTSAFVRQLENNYTRYAGKPLKNARIMDFGCGYGRIFRMLYYYQNPSQLWGVDAWRRSLDLCKESSLPGNFALSEAKPSRLPVGGGQFDLVFSFSVFTHLAPSAAEACLDAIRACLADGGLFVCTIRPVEFWAYIDAERKSNVARRMIREHEARGYAYLPHNGAEGETYGDCSIAFDYFNRPGWKMLGYDWSVLDPYQVSVILQPTL